MQRYHASSCTSAVNNSALGRVQARDTSPAESSSVPQNFALNSRLGPPDFHPQTPTCPEETLTREYAQSGYRETAEGLEEAREISLSQVHSFSKPIILKCKEAIRKCNRAINESRAQKRKAGQVYGVPLSGTLLTKSGIFPEQKPCEEDFRKKWIEGLSQPHKRLRSLADHVPYVYSRNSPLEVLIRNNVSLLRATWFVKVTYLNQVRPTSSNASSGFHEKTQFSRSEQWTKDVIEYLQHLLDEFISRKNSHSTLHIRERSSHVVYAGSVQKSNSLSASIDGEGPSLYTKWWYVVRIIHWHHGEGLVVPSLIIDWVFNQLREKELLGVLQLLLPIIYGVIETVVLSQTYVRTLVGIAIRFIREPSPGGSDLVDNSRRAYTTSAVVEMLRYLILAVPDTFVALDCFPLPMSVGSHVANDGSFLSKMADARKAKDGQIGVSGVPEDRNHKVQAEALSFHNVVSSIKKRAETLSEAVRPSHPGHNLAKDMQVLDQALMHGDIGDAYKFLFENVHDGACPGNWIAEVSPCLHTSLKHIGTVKSALLCSIFFICEWATCEFRDFRTAPPHGLKFTGRKDFSQIFIATRLLKLKNSNMPNLCSSKWRSKDISDIFESPGPLHDTIICWIDQHEVHNEEGFKRLQLLIRELIGAGVFNPHAYVRQLIVSGISDGNGPTLGVERRKRHYKLLKQLPCSYIRDAVEEAYIAEPPILMEAMNIYSNERRLLLNGLSGHIKSTVSTINPVTDIKLEELKASICLLLQLPFDNGVDEPQGRIKRPGGGNNEIDVEETSGCEECQRVKRQKLSEERSSLLQSYAVDEEETWWARKGQNSVESFRADPPHPKPTKQASRGRQKSVRKTQSLAQLAVTARIEGSQGASTSHVCESKISCPHHQTGFDEISKLVKLPSGDIVLIGKILKQMRFVEKRTVSVWLISVVKQLTEEAEKFSAKIAQHGRSLPPVDDRSSMRWRLGEDELSAILYILDVCNELVSATRFLFWLFPKVRSSSGSTIHSRNNPILPRIAVNHVCEVGEAFLISSIRRYENIIVAADLVPETLSTIMHRAAGVLASNGRISSSPTLLYARHLLRKYKNVASVVEWEKTFTSTCDKRLSSELESGRYLQRDLGSPLGVPNGVEDLDDYIRQKISGVRVSRVGLSMKEIVHRHVDEIVQYFYSKDRKPLISGTNKTPSLEKLDNGYQIAQKTVMGLMDCMRQTGGAAQEGDPSLVASAIAAIVNNVGQVIARIPDLPTNSNYVNAPPPSSSLQFAQRILRIHLTCLCILKEALGERQSRVFEVALATEASSALMQAFNANVPNETSSHSNKPVLGRAARIAATVSALVIGAILQGVASLERMVSLFRLKEGLDLINFSRSLKSNLNGNARLISKLDNLIEVSVNWFRVLVGNSRTVSDGLIVQLLGEASVVALSRMQRMLSLNLVFPPAYAICSFVVWRPIINATFSVREEYHQLYQILTVTISDTIKHLPFRDICLRDTHGLYNLIAADTLDSEFVSLLEFNGADINLKASALIPLRSRIFLDALVDCKIPEPEFKPDEKNRVISTQGEFRKQCGENVKKLMSKLVHVLDTLQPAKFHWQWVELRLLLNEQAVNEKLENDLSLIEALRSLSPSSDQSAASENESIFIQIILTRLLVRPDAAPLFAEVVHLLGKSLEDSMLSQAKWLLRGTEVLYGKKSIRQKIVNIAADLKELSLKPQYSKPWGWCHSDINHKGEKWKSEKVGVLEDGEVVDERNNYNQSGKGSSSLIDMEGFIVSQQHVTERALIELILPCVDQVSDDLRYNFASEMIKQISNIEQQINAVTRGVGKPAVTTTPIGSPANKSGNRKSAKSGSPGISRQPTGSADTVPPSPAALRASMTLRLQFLLRLLPIICADREPSGRNMRYALASVILHLLGSRVVHENVGHFINPALLSSKREIHSLMQTSAALLCGESLFDCLLLVFHVLLSCYRPSWLKLKSESKTLECSKDYAVFDREMAENLQNDLNRMELPETIRWRIQTAMPILFPSVRCPVSCQPPSLSPFALACLQPSNPVTVLNPSNSNPPQRNPGRVKTNKAQAFQSDSDLDIDPWTLLEDGTGSGQISSNSAGNDQSNLKASSLLKGTVRVRRTELTYIGALDEDN